MPSSHASRCLAADKLLQAISEKSLTPSQILRELIAIMPKNYVFTTRELLPFASRDNVDTFLWRMVKAQQLERLARGVFREKPAKEDGLILTKEQVLAIKRRAFSGRMARADAGVLAQRSLNSASPANDRARFLSDGSSSSFKLWPDKVTLELKRAGRRLMAMGESEAGRALRNFWLQGARRCKREEVETSLANLSEKELTQVIALKKVMPQWLTEMLPSHIEASETGLISYMQNTLFRLWQLEQLRH
ncbi:MAG: DUF6088 family protein [Candidatus Obscuribacter sp.]|nr:hypothetical protein [Candidatus Melainabacteria bacterium]MDX1990004.1 DUF6088 family protein [Candidatus Obscuribacter sp.]